MKYQPVGFNTEGKPRAAIERFREMEVGLKNNVPKIADPFV
jgi:hypothetical protein